MADTSTAFLTKLFFFFITPPEDSETYHQDNIQFKRTHESLPLSLLSPDLPRE